MSVYLVLNGACLVVVVSINLVCTAQQIGGAGGGLFGEGDDDW